MNDQLPFLPYAGKSGHVADSETSTDRAIHEDGEGITARRQRDVLTFIERQGSHGATWREVADALDLHHGQASGALSVLHKAGAVFIWKHHKRHNCAVYLDASFAPFVRPNERQDEPKQTRNTHELEALNALLDAVDVMLYAQTMPTIQAVRSAFTHYKEVTAWHST